MNTSTCTYTGQVNCVQLCYISIYSYLVTQKLCGHFKHCMITLLHVYRFMYMFRKISMVIKCRYTLPLLNEAIHFTPSFLTSKSWCRINPTSKFIETSIKFTINHSIKIIYPCKGMPIYVLVYEDTCYSMNINQSSVWNTTASCVLRVTERISK